MHIVVSEFAKKTGDFQSLSLVDLKVLALTYQLHKEKCGTDDLRSEPTKQVPQLPNSYTVFLTFPGTKYFAILYRLRWLTKIYREMFLDFMSKARLVVSGLT